MQIGKRVYYDKNTSGILQITEERVGSTVETSIADDFKNYPALAGKSMNQVAVIELPYGAYEEEFLICESISVVNSELQFAIPPELNDSQLRSRVLQLLRSS